MPATAGRVRMPANNRVHSSAALQTHGIWQSAIGYDPYAPNKEDHKDSSHKSSNAEPDADNAYASFQGLLALARITNASDSVDRGACKKCGRVGHLKFQCKNTVKMTDDNDKNAEAMQVSALVGMDKFKGSMEKADKRSKVESDDESDGEDDSDSSDSEVDSEIERIIADRSGKKISGKRGSSRKGRDSDEDDESETDSGKREKRGRSKKRIAKRDSTDSDDTDRRRKRRRQHRRKRDKSSEDDGHKERQRKSRKEKGRRRSRPSDYDSKTSKDSGRLHKSKPRRAASSSDTDSSVSDDSRMGRVAKRSEKSKRCHHEDDA